MRHFGEKICCLVLLLGGVLTSCGQTAAEPENGALPRIVAEYDSISETAPAAIAPAPYTFQFQPHVISKEYLTIYGDDFKDKFFAFCDAVYQVESEVSCDSKEQFYTWLKVARTSFPIAEGIIDKEGSSVSSGVLRIRYKVSRDEAQALVNAFQKTATENIASAIPYEVPDYIKAIELLTFVSQKNQYDYDHTLDDMLTTSPYRAITENIGICQELSGEYIYYLLQVGINAIPCSSLSLDDGEAHEWTLAELDGYFYHIDPTYTLNYPESLFFFGMNDKQREYYGNFPPAKFAFADCDLQDTSKYAADDNRFQSLWLAERYEIHHNERYIQLQDHNTGLYIEFAF